jgi:stress response protein YsnF
LREEVRIRKEVEQDTVEAQETIRREELDVDTQGRPIVDKNI